MRESPEGIAKEGSDMPMISRSEREGQGYAEVCGSQRG